MSIRESARLEELEKTISRGKKTFVEVGMALAEIRDLRLYKREYGGFEEYCREKWGWKRAHAYRLIDAAEVVKVSPIGDKIQSESQARALGKIPTDQRAAVVQAIIDDGKPVTAAAIKQHLPPPPMQPKAAPTLPPPPAEVLDGTGWPVPTQLIPLWKRVDEVQEMLTILSRVKGALRSAQDQKDLLFAEVNYSSALSQLDQAWVDIKTAKPFARRVRGWWPIAAPCAKAAGSSPSTAGTPALRAKTRNSASKPTPHGRVVAGSCRRKQ